MGRTLRLLVFLFFIWTPFPSLLSQQQFKSNVLSSESQGNSPCYRNQRGLRIPQRCVPEFINAAFKRAVESTNTCGEREPVTYCQQTGIQIQKAECSECDSRDASHFHPTRFLTDWDPYRETWWQSDTMEKEMQYPTSINLTINLGKAFDITYVRLTFVSPRPESFAIYKKTHFDSEWTPWQYYSGSCRTTYGLPDRAPILPANEEMAQCNSEFSDISPLTRGEIAFSTLEGRPSAKNFEESEVLQRFVTATDIMISLNRINTYGDEIYNDPKVLQSYYYAISDLAIGGRCKCNGHADVCERSTGEGISFMACDCKHNTTGIDCEMCDPFHQDRPWRAAGMNEANECLPCNCNGLSTKCFFDGTLFKLTGHGGHCVGCSGNTGGVNCEECLGNHYRPFNSTAKACLPCECDELGSQRQQCDESGKCLCKSGVEGEKCDRCRNGFFDFGPNGCRDCQCNIIGSVMSIPGGPICSNEGICKCKANVEGQKCDRCRPGYFNLDIINSFGCSPCFCYGHSSVCSANPAYAKSDIHSNFDKDADDWTAGSQKGSEQVQHDSLKKRIAVGQRGNDPVHYYLPEKFLGDLRFSYNKMAIFYLSTTFNNSTATSSDIRITGGNEKTLTLSIASCNDNSTAPNFKTQKFYFLLHPNQGWNPRLSEIEFISVLNNVTKFSIRGTYNRGEKSYQNERAPWVEKCKCGKEYDGDFCELCSPGYKRMFPSGGPLVKCIPCSCNGHSYSCDAESGSCRCEHNTAGDECNVCARGYYGDALDGKSDSCKSCGCPDGGPCLVEDGEVYCTECPNGTTGARCEHCIDGYFMNLTRKCELCTCNGNIDSNSIGNCDPTNGTCKKCIDHTTGDRCESCEKYYWGSAVSEQKPSCKPCNCYPPGTKHPLDKFEFLECDSETGQCDCLPGVTGLQCNRCEDGHFNITSGTGCHPCVCDLVGSFNTTCDSLSGQCSCKPGVTGRRCDMCAPIHFGFTSEGCSACLCDAYGSEFADCDINSGQCPCRDNVEGRRCNQCSENWYDLKQGCLECDDCYKLIQKRKNQIRSGIQMFRTSSEMAHSTPIKIDDVEFDSEVKRMDTRVRELMNRAQRMDNTNYNNLKARLSNLSHAGTQFNEMMKDFDRINLERDLKKLKHNLNRTIEDGFKNLDMGRQDLAELEQRNHVIQVTPEGSELNRMAKEAQELSRSIESRETKLEEVVYRANLAAKIGLKEAEESVFGRDSHGVDSLQSRVNQLNETFTNLENLARYYANESESLRTQSATALSEVESIEMDKHKYQDGMSGITPEDFLRKAFKKIVADAKAQESKLPENITETLQSAEEKLKDARAVLIKAMRENKKVHDQIGRAKMFKQRAKEAERRAHVTHEQVLKMLDTVNDIVDKPSELRRTYLKELNKMNTIKSMLISAERDIDLLGTYTGQNLPDAERLQVRSELARQEAEAYQAYFKQLQAVFADIQNLIANQTKDLDILQYTLAGIKETRDKLDMNVVANTRRVEESLSRSESANRTASLLKERMESTAKLLEDVMTDLLSFDLDSDKELNGLETKLEELENLVKKHGLDKSIDEIQLRRLETDALKAELLWLREEKNKLQGIYDNLPTTCYNKVHLESN